MGTSRHKADSVRPPNERELLEVFKVIDNTYNYIPVYFPFIPGIPIIVIKNVF